MHIPGFRFRGSEALGEVINLRLRRLYTDPSEEYIYFYARRTLIFSCLPLFSTPPLAAEVY